MKSGMQEMRSMKLETELRPLQ